MSVANGEHSSPLYLRASACGPHSADWTEASPAEARLVEYERRLAGMEARLQQQSMRLQVWVMILRIPCSARAAFATPNHESDAHRNCRHKSKIWRSGKKQWQETPRI
jgi:hypothetical protein